MGLSIMDLCKHVSLYEVFYIMADLGISFMDMFMDLNLAPRSAIKLT